MQCKVGPGVTHLAQASRLWSCEDATRLPPISVPATVHFARVQGVSSRDIKLENTLVDGSPRPLIKVSCRPLHAVDGCCCFCSTLAGCHALSDAPLHASGKTCMPPPANVLPSPVSLHPCS